MGILLVLPAVLAAAIVPQPAEYRFEIARDTGVLYNPWTQTDDRVELRAFKGKGIAPGDFVAPTIRVAPGQQLAIDIDNRLEPCTAAQRATQQCFNDTNLHTHGLWVSPSGNSDNVMVSIPPGANSSIAIIFRATIRRGPSGTTRTATARASFRSEAGWRGR